MNNYKKHIYVIYLLTIGITFLGCTTDDVSIKPTKISFTFAHNVGDESLVFNKIQYVNWEEVEYSVETLKYFVSDIALHKSNGVTVILDAEHYVDATDNTTLHFEPEDEFSNGEYTHISFTFGLDASKNESGKYVNPPESNMEWPMAMGTGYHYLKLEGKYESSGTSGNYQCHTGQSMGNPYFVNVTLPASSFVASGQDLDVQIVMDINKWWENPKSLSLEDVSMIMGNQEMQQHLKDNGYDVFSVGYIQ